MVILLTFSVITVINFFCLHYHYWSEEWSSQMWTHCMQLCKEGFKSQVFNRLTLQKSRIVQFFLCNYVNCIHNWKHYSSFDFFSTVDVWSILCRRNSMVIPIIIITIIVLFCLLIFYCNCLPLKGWQDQCPSRAGSAEVQWCFGRHQNLPTGFPKQNAFPRIQAEVFIWFVSGARIFF